MLDIVVIYRTPVLGAYKFGVINGNYCKEFAGDLDDIMLERLLRSLYDRGFVTVNCLNSQVDMPVMYAYKRKGVQM